MSSSETDTENVTTGSRIRSRFRADDSRISFTNGSSKYTDSSDLSDDDIELTIKNRHRASEESVSLMSNVNRGRRKSESSSFVESPYSRRRSLASSSLFGSSSAASSRQASLQNLNLPTALPMPYAVTPNEGRDTKFLFRHVYLVAESKMWLLGLLVSFPVGAVSLSLGGSVTGLLDQTSEQFYGSWIAGWLYIATSVIFTIGWVGPLVVAVQPLTRAVRIMAIGTVLWILNGAIYLISLLHPHWWKARTTESKTRVATISLTLIAMFAIVNECAKYLSSRRDWTKQNHHHSEMVPSPGLHSQLTFDQSPPQQHPEEVTKISPPRRACFWMILKPVATLVFAGLVTLVYFGVQGLDESLSDNTKLVMALMVIPAAHIPAAFYGRQYAIYLRQRHVAFSNLLPLTVMLSRYSGTRQVLFTLSTSRQVALGSLATSIVEVIHRLLAPRMRRMLRDMEKGQYGLLRTK
eukprot:GFYU01019662.1.p1 GENE.GFYU01019662.1~~GFYU01019662.1.p1  ORF type:complete len:491 (-),score=30.69 GFYU01019662.1:28-1422(-)